MVAASEKAVSRAEQPPDPELQLTKARAARRGGLGSVSDQAQEANKPPSRKRLIDLLASGDEDYDLESRRAAPRRNTRSSSGPIAVDDEAERPSQHPEIDSGGFYGKVVTPQRADEHATRSSSRLVKQDPRAHKARTPSPPRWTEENPHWSHDWKSSIIYPKVGKNRATVNMQDIERLDEGQFLNDSLINFYLRYMEQKLVDKNAELAKRVYFHNTFFYKTLTTGGKRHKGVNYEAVERWTSKVDLLSYDYIIVPVNEQTHWYLAIICNAPKLLPTIPKTSGGSPTVEKDYSEKQEIATGDNVAPPRSPSPFSTSDRGLRTPAQAGGSDQEFSLETLSIQENGDRPQPGEIPELIHGSLSLPPRNLVSIPDSLDGHFNENAGKHSTPPLVVSDSVQANTKVSTPLKKGKRKSQVPRKHDPKEPKIVTLDSIGASHSPTCINLRDYIVAEIKSRKGVEITPPGALGITAIDIPQQDNYCDCGLFLLSYVEKFLEQPDEFVHNIFQRTRDLTEWTQAPDMRNKIRDLLFQLQAEQKLEADKQQSLKGKGKKKYSSDMKTKTSEPTITQDISPSAYSSSAHADREEAKVLSKSIISSTRAAPNLGRKRSVSKDLNLSEIYEKSKHRDTEDTKPQRKDATNSTSRTVPVLELDDSGVSDLNLQQKPGGEAVVFLAPSSASAPDAGNPLDSTRFGGQSMMDPMLNPIGGSLGTQKSTRTSDSSRPGGSVSDALGIQESPQKTNAIYAHLRPRTPGRRRNFVSPTPEEDLSPDLRKHHGISSPHPQTEGVVTIIEDDEVIASVQSSASANLGQLEETHGGITQNKDGADTNARSGLSLLSDPCSPSTSSSFSTISENPRKVHPFRRTSG